jgi:hypothetical protein
MRDSPASRHSVWARVIRRSAVLPLAFTVLTCVPAAGVAPKTPQGLVGIHHFGDGVSSPSDVVANGRDLWVGNGNFISEFSESTGALVKNISLKHGDAEELSANGGMLWAVGSTYVQEVSEKTGLETASVALPAPTGYCASFLCPNEISFDGTDVWIANAGAGTLTEISNSTDQIVTTLSNLNRPSAVASDGKNLWVVDDIGIQELSASTGSSEQTIDVAGAAGVTIADGEVWIAAGKSLLEFSASSGELMQRIKTGDELAGGESGISLARGHLWALYNGVLTVRGNRYAGCIGLYEFSASTGALLRVITGAKYGLGNRAEGVVASNSRVWILDPAVPGSLAELTARTAAPIIAPSQRYDLWPSAIAGDTQHVWVANASADAYPDAPLSTVTELSATTGRQIAVFANPRQPFGGVLQMIDDGHDVWIVGLPQQQAYNPQRAILTELDSSTGAIVQRFPIPVGTGQSTDLTWQPTFTLSDGRLWVTRSPSSVTEYSAATGAFVHFWLCTKIGLKGGVFGITSDDGHVFVAGMHRLAVLSARTGQLLHLYAGPTYDPLGFGLEQWSAIGGRLWTESTLPQAQSTVFTEYSETTGKEVRAITQQHLGLAFITTMGVFGGNLWISAVTATTSYEDAVLELSATTGSLEHTYVGWAYGFPTGADQLTVVGTHVWACSSAEMTEWQY